jgi:hypothetical protein
MPVQPSEFTGGNGSDADVIQTQNPDFGPDFFFSLYTRLISQLANILQFP